MIKDFKEVTQNVYDFANRWGTGKVFLKRRVMLKWALDMNKIYNQIIDTFSYYLIEYEVYFDSFFKCTCTFLETDVFIVYIYNKWGIGGIIRAFYYTCKHLKENIVY